MTSLYNTTTVQTLSAVMSPANIKLFFELTNCFLRNTYSVTTRSLSRFGNYSLRQLFRFLSSQHHWAAIRILLFSIYFYRSDQPYLLAIDETVVGKSGEKWGKVGKKPTENHTSTVP
jgi:hypothetical protein